jgi:cyanophycinase-like exopeptidase
VGIDEETALVRDPDGGWRVAGAGVVSLYEGRSTREFASGSKVDALG